MALRVEQARRSDHCGEGRRFMERERRGRMPEVPASCRLHAVGPSASFDRVQIELEDSILREDALYFQGNGHFPELAPRASRRREVEIFGELLRDGRASNPDPSPFEVR